KAAADTEGNGNQCLCAGQNIVFDGGENRSDHGQRQIAGYQYRYQRGDEQVDDLRYNFVQFLFQSRHQPHGDDYGDHVSLVAHQIDIIQSEPCGGSGDLGRIHASYAPGIQKIRMDHNHTDDGAQEKVASKSPGGTDGDQNGQEYESRVAEQMDDRIGSGFRHGRPYIGQTFQ